MLRRLPNGKAFIMGGRPSSREFITLEQTHVARAGDDEAAFDKADNGGIFSG